jgi:7-cyano-7-deazaguanine synthase
MDARNQPRSVNVLLSGGIDSSACVSYYFERGFDVSALFIDYGQSAARQETLAASAVAEHFGIQLHRLQIGRAHIKRDGLILGRNAFLLSCALLECSPQTHLISIGIHSGTNYVDCSPLFVERMQAVFDAYTNGGVRIDAPFIHWMKCDVWNYVRSRGVPIDLTYSCELGSDSPCGICASCRDMEELHART